MEKEKIVIEGTVTFLWTDEERKLRSFFDPKVVACVCCPPFDNTIPHRHRYSNGVDFDKDFYFSDFINDLTNPFEMEGKRIRITFEVVEE